MKGIYLDHAATTYVKPQVLAAMLPYFTDCFGNASSVHAYGREAKKAMEDARTKTAAALNAEPGEIFFTGGGSESDNTALKGAALAYAKKGAHIVTIAIEHHAILHACQWLEKNAGIAVTYLPVDEKGRVTAKQVAEAIRPETILVSVMFANNEVGTIEPVAEIGQVCREKGVLFHTDAVQAVGAVPVDVKAMNIDLLSLSAHKFYGPKGVGALYVRKGVRLPGLIQGGPQERGKRAGTENIPAIVGLGEAIRLAVENMERESRRLKALRDRLMEGLLEKIPHSFVNGDLTNRLPNNLNLRFSGVEGESLLLHLDSLGVAASSGSACTSGSLDPSHVLLAMGLSRQEARGSLRLTLGDCNTQQDVELLLEKLPEIVQGLRQSAFCP